MRSAKLDGAELHACIPADHTALREQSQISEAVRDVLLSRLVGDVIWISDALMLACPVHITITDQHGRRLTDTGVDEIPGASLTTDDETGIIATYLDPNLQYKVYIEAYQRGMFTLVKLLWSEGSELVVRLFKDVPVQESTTAEVEIIPGVEDCIMYVDFDGDGVVDVEMDSRSSPEALPSSLIQHGPNPIPAEGCIFWLKLPDDTVDATLKIFDIDGALLVSIPLDATADRYPAAGRWLPEDDQGRLLGTGLYLYLVEIEHTDGTVTYSPVQKMVIQR